MMDPEKQPLRSQAGSGKYLGLDIEIDDKDWDYAMVFPKLDTDAKKKEFDTTVNGQELGKEMFLSATMWKKHQHRFTTQMKKIDFHGELRKLLVDHLCGPECGFSLSTKTSIDGDELFLLIRMPEDSAKKIADMREIKMPVKPTKYPKDLDDSSRTVTGRYGMCPTSNFRNGRFVRVEEDNTAIPIPMYLEYELEMKDIYQQFEDKDKLRLLFVHINSFIDIRRLLKHQILKKAFPIHHWETVQELSSNGWARLLPQFLCNCLPGNIDDKVRNYYGEEVAFFFHWLDSYNMCIIPIALLAAACFLRRLFFTGDMQRFIAIGFSATMCIWAAAFNSYYQQRANLKSLQWGMQHFEGIATLRPGFDKAKLGSLRVSFIKSCHWLFVLLVLFELLAVVASISSFRRYALKNPSDTTYGLSNPLASKIAKYLLTVNIKVVAILFQVISPKITAYENFRTDLQCSNANIRKQFIVKGFAYYYPFLYILFLKRYVEGCFQDGVRVSCIHEVEDNLQIFFITYIASFVGLEILYPFLSTWYRIRYEVIKDKSLTGFAKIKRKLEVFSLDKKLRPYSYIEAQAKCDEYVGMSDAFMELVLGYGYIVMFSVAYPFMTVLAMLSNMVVVRILAYRVTFLEQRAFPFGQEGIGAWKGILELLTFMGVVLNACSVVFEMKPLALFDTKHKLIDFIFIEHVMMLVVFVSSIAIRPKSVVQEATEERNAECVDAIMCPGEGTETDLMLRSPSKAIELPLDGKVS